MFCPKCKSLQVRRTVRGRVSMYCPQCDGMGSAQKPMAWFTKDGGGPERSRQAARVAARAKPVVVASDKRAVAGGQRKRPQELPPPPKLEVAPGTDLFPFSTIRDGQREFIADVAQTVRDGGHLLAHAPTGLGKTVSTLAPVVAYALANEKRVFFLTSKQSQHKIAVDTLKAIRQKAGVPFIVSDVIGKQDMCPRREARELFPKRFADFCQRERVSHTCDYWENANADAIKVLRQRIHHVEELVVTSTECVACPHQAALDLAAQAHVVVCDYNYFFSDLREQMQERLRLDLSKVILIVDEAHNLPDRIRDHLKLRFDDYVINDALEEAKDLKDMALTKRLEVLPAVLEALAEMEEERDPHDQDARRGGTERYIGRDQLIDVVNEALRRRAGTLVATDYDGLVSDLQLAVEDYEDEFKEGSSGLAKLHAFLTNWRRNRRGLARILDREPTPSLTYHILDPAVLAKPVFDGIHASIVMSGTLHPMEMMRDVLGLAGERAQMREYISPFPQENRLVVIDSVVTTTYKDRSPEMYRLFGTRLAEVARATPGHTAAFFPSYRLMEMIRPFAEQELDGSLDVIVEERGLDKSEKEGLIQTMRHAPDKALLMGVQGGSLSEGYDYEDNLLKAVVIVGVPYGTPSLETESLIGYYNQKFGVGKGRPYAYNHPTFHRVLQAVGRCIRGPDDRGVIVMMDKRFGWSSNQASYPRDFKPRPSADVPADVRRFWGQRTR